MSTSGARARTTTDTHGEEISDATSATSLDDARPSASRRTVLLATVALVLVTASWGSTFFLIKDLLDRVPALDFLAVRFLLAGLVLLAVFPKAVGRMTRSTRRQAVVLGALYGFAQMLQTMGLANTSASVSGFITGMYVVFTPLLAAWLLRDRISTTTWAAVVLATVGLGVLTLQGVSLGTGEAITLVASVLFAAHIVALGAWSRPEEAFGLAIIQLLVISAICFVFTAPNGVVLPDNRQDWIALVYMALVPAALALLVQTWAQAHLPAARAAIIMSLEPVFASTFAVGAGDDDLSGRLLLGGALVLAAMLVVEITPRRTREVHSADQAL
ncbi:DMT family transporter [Nocardioides yefusunii]|uniref:DMT family transporter n=1 Tax=Nocardioides yefusunii TaxID=2500546 RepID=A0ABW1QWI1_9ACTN|nr:DMT family transporter [Nocardioides yefusunii]